jgi:hypothetical protein
MDELICDRPRIKSTVVWLLWTDTYGCMQTLWVDPKDVDADKLIAETQGGTVQ